MNKWCLSGFAAILAGVIGYGAATAHDSWGRSGNHSGEYAGPGRGDDCGPGGLRRWGPERRKLRAQILFDELDANGDGNLDMAEIEGARERRFTLIDANGDGFLDGEELFDYRMRRRAKIMILRFDEDDDGRLSIEETPHRTPSFERFDLDENGVVTKTEMGHAMGRRGSWDECSGGGKPGRQE